MHMHMLRSRQTTWQSLGGNSLLLSGNIHTVSSQHMLHHLEDMCEVALRKKNSKTNKQVKLTSWREEIKTSPVHKKSVAFMSDNVSAAIAPILFQTFAAWRSRMMSYRSSALPCSPPPPPPPPTPLRPPPALLPTRAEPLPVHGRKQWLCEARQ